MVPCSEEWHVVLCGDGKLLRRGGDIGYRLIREGATARLPVTKLQDTFRKEVDLGRVEE